jgi:hypothetical protein
MVSFRLSPLEYAEVSERLRASGHRSMSSFGLSAIRAFNPRGRVEAAETQELRRRVDDLAIAFDRLTERINSKSDSYPAGAK